MLQEVDGIRILQEYGLLKPNTPWKTAFENEIRLSSTCSRVDREEVGY